MSDVASTDRGLGDPKEGDAAESALASPLSAVTTVLIDSLLPADSPRAGQLDLQHVRKLMAVRKLPPIIVHRPTMRVIDGMHRVQATVLMDRTEIEARFFDGTIEDAFVLAVRMNIRHGLQLSRTQRSAAAKRIMVLRPDWSNRVVAAVSGLSAKTVAEIRRRASDEIPQLPTRVGLDGRVRPVNGAEGRRRAAEFIRANPRASLREIASAAGVSVGTARNVRHQDNRMPPGNCAVPDGSGSPANDQAGERQPRRRHADALTVLYKDPSLRQSESGRQLLRLLDNGALSAVRRDEVIAKLPPHSRSAILAAIRQCMQTWHEFGERLESVTNEGNAASEG
ncbi:MAG: ParB/RepB/Spo0J family partition protein [Spirillospora sp.]